MGLDMAVTIVKIAQHLGLSPPTVSHILNKRGRFREETRQRVFQAALELGYVPNGAARSMRNQRSRQVGILIRNNPDQRFRNVVAFETILGINEALEQAGYIAVLVRVGDVRSNADSRVFRERLLDGMIVLSAVPPDIEQMVEQVMPQCVWVDSNLWRPQRVIRRDERQAGRLAATALADLGYQKLLWYGQPNGRGANYHYSLVDRLAGVRQVAKKHQLDLSSVLASRKAVYHKPQLLNQYLRPEVGIIAYSTTYARWLAHYAASLGLCPGYDFGLVCCDDSHDLHRQWPGLSRATFNRFGMGKGAAEMLIDLIEGRECPSRKLSSRWQPGNTAWGPERFERPTMP
jgi:LacI family transcriptional regulator